LNNWPHFGRDNEEDQKTVRVEIHHSITGLSAAAPRRIDQRVLWQVLDVCPTTNSNKLPDQKRLDKGLLPRNSVGTHTAHHCLPKTTARV